jgi:hypothetical protein
MKTIEYKIRFTGATKGRGEREFLSDADHGPSTEYAKVQARDINSGYSKALKVALEPLGNGTRREIGSVEFWQVL